MRYLLILFVFWSVNAWAACSGSSPSLTAADCSATEINLCIADSQAGDTITVPSGASCNWTSLDTVSGITISSTGTGTSTPDGAVVTSGGITLNKHASSRTHMTGISLTSGATLTIGGSHHDYPLIIDEMHFDFNGNSGPSSLWSHGVDGVLIHSSYFTSTGIASDCIGEEEMIQAEFGSGTPTTTVFGADPEIGAWDTDDDGDGIGGDSSIYFEDNTFNNLCERVVDHDNGSSGYFVNNSFTDTGVMQHGGDNDSVTLQDSSTHGARFMVFIDNTFNRVVDNKSVNYFLKWRGSGGVALRNTFDEVDTETYGSKNEILLLVGCAGTSPAWPMKWQVGQIYPTAENPPTFPLMLIKNTFNGTKTVGIDENEGPGATCASPGSYITEGRDYMDTDIDGKLKSGLRSARSSTCTAASTGTAADFYWSTDGGGDWNSQGADGGLDKCTATNTWTDDWWVPLDYPHPWRSGATDTPDVSGRGVSLTYFHSLMAAAIGLGLLGGIFYVGRALAQSGRNRPASGLGRVRYGGYS